MINHDIWRFPAQIGGTPIDRWFLWTGKCQKNGWWFGGSPISGNYYTILYKILLQYGLLWEFPEILEAYHPILIRTENWKPWMPWMPWTLASTFFGWLGPSSSSSSRVWHQWTLRLHAFFSASRSYVQRSHRGNPARHDGGIPIDRWFLCFCENVGKCPFI